MPPKDVHVLILEPVNVSGYMAKGIKAADGVKVDNQPTQMMETYPGLSGGSKVTTRTLRARENRRCQSDAV